MQIRIFTVPLFGGEEASEEMNKFLRGNKVVDITKSMVHQGDVAYWAFCVTYLFGVPSKAQPSQMERKEKIDYRNVLDGPIFARFAVLRSIRKRLAEADAVPAFAVFTDAELAELAKLEELTPKKMLTVHGIGEKRVEKYGESIAGSIWSKLSPTRRIRSNHEKGGKFDAIHCRFGQPVFGLS